MHFNNQELICLINASLFSVGVDFGLDKSCLEPGLHFITNIYGPFILSRTFNVSVNSYLSLTWKELS
jgi:hypothetical protein